MAGPVAQRRHIPKSEKEVDVRYRAVRRIVRKIVAFPRWLLSPEQLPEPPGDDREAVSGGPGVVRRLLRSDELVTELPAKPKTTVPQRFTLWVLSSERLPSPPAEPIAVVRRGRSFWSWLLSNDELPQHGAAESRRISRERFLRSLLSPEACPRYESLAAQRRRGVVRWLLSREEL